MESENQATPVPIASPAPKNNKLLILSISFGVLILLTITGWLFYQNRLLRKEISSIQVQPDFQVQPAAESTPTPDPTENWKTYTNEKYGFEFTYPRKYVLYDNLPERNPGEQMEFGLSLDQQKYTIDSQQPSISLEIKKVINGKYILINKLKSLTYLKGMKENDLIIDEIKFTKITYYLEVNAPLRNQTQYYTDKEGLTLIFTAKYNSPDKDPEAKDIDQILSTFKFVK